MQVSRIDHVHLEVSDRETAANWYKRVLGLTKHPDLATWADDPMGPLILEAGDGQPALSLFARDFKDASRDATIAFRLDGNGFLDFCSALGILDLRNRLGEQVTRANIVDHEVSWSIYFLDPDQNRLEVTTYDYDAIAKAFS